MHFFTPSESRGLLNRFTPRSEQVVAKPPDFYSIGNFQSFPDTRWLYQEGIDSKLVCSLDILLLLRRGEDNHHNPSKTRLPLNPIEHFQAMHPG